ncbi:MAG: ethylbenzene dehydrogenase-related protein [Candidatus Thorarchaeota archaeon]
MKTKKLFSVLVALGFIVTILFASQNVIALPDGITLTASSTTDTITIDGDNMESAWNDADTLIIPSIEGSGINVVLKALSDDMYIYIFAAWNDSVMDNTRKGWSYNGTHWDNVGGNEDRIEFAWSLGADIVCGHNPATADSMLFDVWHWKASRTAVGGWADDKYWDGTGRHSDAKSAGGYSDNSVVAQAENSSVITTALGNSTNVAAFSDDDRPFWDNSGVEITWTAGVNATPVSDFVNGYKTVVPTGSRGDVLAESVHNGTAWNVEFKRALDTGNTDDDVAFSAGSSVPFYVAVHNNSGDDNHYNNSGDDNHYRAGGATPSTFQLSIPSVSTTTTTTIPTTTPTSPSTTPTGLDQTLLIGAAVVGIVVVVVILVFVKRR